MKKQNLLKWIGMLVVALAMTACSDDDTSTPTAKRYVVTRIETISDGSPTGEESSYNYDAQGRPTESILRTFVDDKILIMRDIYDYADGMIIQNDTCDFPERYKLDEHNRIVEDSHYNYTEKAYVSRKFTYDAEGQLATCVDGNDTYTFKWENGDIVSYVCTSEGKTVSYCTIVPSAIESPLSLIDHIYHAINELLYVQGYYGKVTRHLPASYEKKTEEVAEAKGGITSTSVYNYKLVDGQVTEYTVNGMMDVNVFGIITKKETSSTYRISWKEL